MQKTLSFYLIYFFDLLFDEWLNNDILRIVLRQMAIFATPANFKFLLHFISEKARSPRRKMSGAPPLPLKEKTFGCNFGRGGVYGGGFFNTKSDFEEPLNKNKI